MCRYPMNKLIIWLFYLPNNSGLFPSFSSSPRQRCALAWTIWRHQQITHLSRWAPIAVLKIIEWHMPHQLTIGHNLPICYNLPYCTVFSPLIGCSISLLTNIAQFTFLEATIIVSAIHIDNGCQLKHKLYNYHSKVNIELLKSKEVDICCYQIISMCINHCSNIAYWLSLCQYFIL
jgi:hypothetical protein